MLGEEAGSGERESDSDI